MAFSLTHILSQATKRLTKAITSAYKTVIGPKTSYTSPTHPYDAVKVDEKDILPDHNAHLVLPVLSNGTHPNLFTGDYSVSATVKGVTDSVEQHNSPSTTKRDIVGLGASEDLQNEITTLNNTFTRIPPDGNITEMQPDDPISFLHVSHFIPDHTIKPTSPIIAPEQSSLEPLLHKHSEQTGPVTAKLQGTFDVLLVRTPNHDCTPAPKIGEALKDQVRFYFMHMPDIQKDIQLTYESLEANNGALAKQYGFTKDKDGNFVKKLIEQNDASEASIQKVSTDTIMIRKNMGDKCTFHKQPLQMNVALQYAPDDYNYEMGGAKGLHLHTVGKLILDGKEVQLGGHILGFNNFKIHEMEIMKVKRTTVKEHDGYGNNASYREAYGWNNIGHTILMQALLRNGYKANNMPAMLIDALNYIKPITANSFMADPTNIWSSVICDNTKRKVRCEKLETELATTIHNKSTLGEEAFFTELAGHKSYPLRVVG